MTRRPFSRWAVCIAAVVSLLAAACGGGGDDETRSTTQGTGADRHKGVEVTVLTFTGPQIAEPLQRRAPDFNGQTGATIKVVTVPFADLYDKIPPTWPRAPTATTRSCSTRSGWATSSRPATWRTSPTGSRATRR
jgi:hypothetical protein